MKNILLIIQIISAICLTVVILMQTKGTGFGRTFGGSGSSNFSRRGVERLVFRLTFFLTALFLTVSIVQLFF
jgi:protein translocase SecG subunit